MRTVTDGGSGFPAGVLPEGARRGPGTSSFIDLYSLRAWLIRDGHVVRGPVDISAGGPGVETPIGTFPVLWKEEFHISAEFAGRSMPHAVFFTTGGVAFHAGSLATPSGGCIKMPAEEAEAWFAALEVGDEIVVHGSRKPMERACRVGLSARPTVAERMICHTVRKVDAFTEHVLLRRRQRAAAQTGTGPR